MVELTAVGEEETRVTVATAPPLGQAGLLVEWRREIGKGAGTWCGISGEGSATHPSYG